MSGSLVLQDEKNNVLMFPSIWSQGKTVRLLKLSGGGESRERVGSLALGRRGFGRTGCLSRFLLILLLCEVMRMRRAALLETYFLTIHRRKGS